MSASHHHHHTTLDSSSSAAKGKKPYKSWLKDGVNAGQSSMEILVRWLSDKNNYAKWRGDYHDTTDPTSTTITASPNPHANITNHHEQHHRTPKKVLLEEIVNEMRKAGIYHRYPKDVASKISTLQSNYRAARDWYEAEGKRLMQQGAVKSAIHEEIQKRFPYWDALHESFGSSSSSSNSSTNIRSPAPSFSSPPSSSPDPMSLSSIIDHQQQYCQEDEDEDDQLAQDDDDDGDCDNDDQNSNTNSSGNITSSSNHDDDNDDDDDDDDDVVDDDVNDDDDDDDDYIDREEQVSSRKRRQVQSDDDKDTAQVDKSVLGNSLIQVTREKEAGRMRRSRDILEFLRKKRMNREQYLIEKERTRRIRAKADLVRNLTDAGFSKQEISEQLSML